MSDRVKVLKYIKDSVQENQNPKMVVLKNRANYLDLKTDVILLLIIASSIFLLVGIESIDELLFLGFLMGFIILYILGLFFLFFKKRKEYIIIMELLTESRLADMGDEK